MYISRGSVATQLESLHCKLLVECSGKS